MKTADGADFILGMTLYLPVGGSVENIRQVPTSPDEHAIDTFEYHGQTVHCIGRKGSGLGTDLLRFYASPNAIIQRRIDELRYKAKAIEQEIACLETLKAN
jgi:hypothetical protein